MSPAKARHLPAFGLPAPGPDELNLL